MTKHVGQVSLEGELKLHSMVNRFKVWNAQLSDDEVYSLYKFRESLVWDGKGERRRTAL